MEIGKLYVIQWRDAAGPALEDGEKWMFVSQIEDCEGMKDTDLVTSFGVLIKETDSFIYIASHFHAAAVHSIMAIPLSALVRLWYIGLGEINPTILKPIQEDINKCILS